MKKEKRKSTTVFWVWYDSRKAVMKIKIEKKNEQNPDENFFSLLFSLNCHCLYISLCCRRCYFFLFYCKSIWTNREKKRRYTFTQTKRTHKYTKNTKNWNEMNLTHNAEFLRRKRKLLLLIHYVEHSQRDWFEFQRTKAHFLIISIASRV